MPLTWEVDPPVAAAGDARPTTPTRASPRSRRTRGRRASDPRLPARCTRWARSLPQECVRITAHDFAQHDLHDHAPRAVYQSWLEAADLRPLYRAHRRCSSTCSGARPAQRWVLKSPGHLWCLDALLADYPDARWCRRTAIRCASSRRSRTSRRCCAACRATASIGPRSAPSGPRGWPMASAVDATSAITCRPRPRRSSTCTSASSSATRSAWCGASTPTSDST